MRGLFCLALLAGCGGAPAVIDAGVEPVTEVDAGLPPDAGVDAGDPWADRLVRFTPGPGAGFGQDRLPGVVLGAPSGAGDSSGSLDVLSLGKGGAIELEFLDVMAIDGPGVDLLVFENGFIGFLETGVVEVSSDGLDWRLFPCAATQDAGMTGCAGTRPVYANPAQGISGTDPAVAGGDGFDLSQVGLTTARFVRITDSGANSGGGFDLDAIAVVNGQAVGP